MKTFEHCCNSFEFTKECFSFNVITVEDALKEISMLDSSKDIGYQRTSKGNKRQQ